MIHGILNGNDLLGYFIGDFNIKSLFHGHDQLDQVKRISSQIIDKRCLRHHLVPVNAQLLGNNINEFLIY